MERWYVHAQNRLFQSNMVQSAYTYVRAFGGTACGYIKPPPPLSLGRVVSSNDCISSSRIHARSTQPIWRASTPSVRIYSFNKSTYSHTHAHMCVHTRARAISHKVGLCESHSLGGLNPEMRDEDAPNRRRYFDALARTCRWRAAIARLTIC